jgi:hypothetical protein
LPSRTATQSPSADAARTGQSLTPSARPGCFDSPRNDVGNDDDFTLGAFAKADLIGVCIRPDPILTLSARVLEPTDPATSASWRYGETFLAFELRPRGTGDDPDWIVLADVDGADVYDVRSGRHLCSAHFRKFADEYLVSFPSRCIGSPFHLSVAAWFEYDTGPEYGGPIYFDDTAWSTPVSPISWKYSLLGGLRSVLGAPTSAIHTLAGEGRWQQFERGRIYHHPSSGANEVHGAIASTWLALGAQAGPLGYPATDERATSDGRGRYNDFTGGSIYWSQATGAREVRGAIGGTWRQLGAEKSGLGYPVTNEIAVGDGRGRVNHFERGSVYWSPSTGAREVRGAIRGTWDRLAGARGALGYPVTNETGTPDGRGRFNHFERGSVYWSQATGAHDVRGAIRAHWASLGWERGRLGYPVSGEYAAPGGQRSDFQGGSVFWDRRTGRTSVTWR